MTHPFFFFLDAKQRLFSEVESQNHHSESISSVQSCVSRWSRRSIKSRWSMHSSKSATTYQPSQHLSPNFNMIKQADVETVFILRDLSFATTDQNGQKEKLLIEDEIEYEKVKTNTLIEQTQRK